MLLPSITTHEQLMEWVTALGHLARQSLSFLLGGIPWVTDFNIRWLKELSKIFAYQLTSSATIRFIPGAQPVDVKPAGMHCGKRCCSTIGLQPIELFSRTGVLLIMLDFDSRNSSPSSVLLPFS